MSRIHYFLLRLIAMAILSRFHASFTIEAKNNSLESFRLPENIYPEIYRLNILTNLADLNDNFTFMGRVMIQVTCKIPTNKIVLHSKNLEIEHNKVRVIEFKEMQRGVMELINDLNCNAECRKVNGEIDIIRHSHEDESDFYTIYLKETLTSGESYTIYIPFSGELSTSLTGYYRSSYIDDSSKETRWLAVTQFESTDARRAFPCFDEPAFKARFQLNLGHKDHLTSISNTRLLTTEPLRGMPNWVEDQYEITLPMSTYLLAFVVSDFHYKMSPKSKTSDVTFRVWARKNAINQVDYASLAGPRILEFFEQYFDYKYPLPKMDMIAIPDFSAGAMENWGLITYRETALLYDQAASTASSQSSISSIIAHELAHQWFGNLVTMKWWSDLWLNEGFATYVGALGVNYLHPDWQNLDEELVDNMLSVFSADSLVASHPISVPIVNPKDIAQIFDAISYKKGAFVLRMMNLFLGEETFRQGVNNYLKKHAYRNAEQDDLWSSLTDAAHKTKALPTYMTVKRIMDSWTLQKGYPLITVARDYKTGIMVVSQERFFAEPDNPYNPPCETKYWVPLSYTYASEANFNNTKPKEWLNAEKSKITIEGLPKEDWVIFNIKISGLYRVNYDEENWRRLSSELCKNCNGIDVLNRVQLIEDSLELAKKGVISYGIPFKILPYLRRDSNYLTWKTALRNLGFIDKMLRFFPAYGPFRKYMRDLLSSIYVEFFEYENTPENLMKIKHQTLIASWACKFDVGNCRKKAISSFEKWMESTDPDSNIPIPKELRSHTYCTAIRYGGETEWNFLWHRYLQSNVGSEKSIILNALGCAKDVWLLNRYLDWSVSDHSGIRKQDSPSVFVSVARGDIGHFVAKMFFESRINDIYYFYKDKLSRLGTYVSAIASLITSRNEYYEFEQFLKTRGFMFKESHQAVLQAKETAIINVKWHENFYETFINLFRNAETCN